MHDHVATGGWIAPPRGAGRSGRKKAAILAGLAAIVAITGIKIATNLLAESVAATMFGSMFGGPTDQVPADFRSGMEIRINAVLPANFDRLSRADQVAWTHEQFAGGFPRLDDATLTRFHRLQAAGFDQMPVAACAAMVREKANSGKKFSPTNNAISVALDGSQRKEFVEVYVEALEAQARRTPVPRTVTEDEANRVLDEVRGLATPDELSAIQAGGSDSTKSDAVQCAVLRAVFDISLRLPAAELATLARYRMQP